MDYKDKRYHAVDGTRRLLRMRRCSGFPLWVLRVAVVVAALATVGAAAEETSQPIRPTSLGMIGEFLDVDLHRSEVINVPWPVKRVAIADPTIADVEAIEPDQVLIVGQSVGLTDLIIWDENGKIWRTKIRVQVDLQQLNDDLAFLFPGQTVAATRSHDVYFVKGDLARAEQAEELRRFFETKQIKYVDLTRVSGLHQVQIKVRVAEVSRDAVRNMGVNLFKTSNDWFGAATVGSATGGALNPVNIGVPQDSLVGLPLPFEFLSDVATNPLVTLLAGFPEEDLELFIQALAENRYLKILAEPTLVALSGESASFLVGGEFPIPVVQGGAAGGTTSISIEYKQFGVQLQFDPIVLGDGTIRLHVAPEVSELSSIGGVEIQGFSVPSVVTRKIETTVELKSGQTFAMAGLLSRVSNARNSRVPLLGDLPILGALFRSVSYQNAETELVVLVTAELTEPLSDPALPPLPGDLHVSPNDWEFFLGGRIQGNIKRIAHAQGIRLNIDGLDRLRGPGAWDSYYP